MNLQIISLFPIIVLTQWAECNNPLLIGNGQCDKYNNNILCNFDGGECCKTSDCNSGNNCEFSWIGDGDCDYRNNFAACGNFDGGDCEN